MRLTSILFKSVGEWSKKYMNLPDRYIKRRMRLIYWKAPPNKPQYRKKVEEEKIEFFSTARPWESTFHYHIFAKRKMPLIEPIKDWSFFRGDLVEVLVGMDKGKQGHVQKIYQERNWITVEGLNAPIIEHPDFKKDENLVFREELPLLINTDVALVDPSDMMPTEVEWRYTSDGEKVRVSIRTGKIIPIPASAEETIDYKTPVLYSTQKNDTPAADALALTFEPSLKTFEMDIMDSMGIKEDRVQKKIYWY